MTITIPTCELVGLLSDTHPFAHPDKEVTAWNSVHVRWDGEMLHALATNGVAAAWSMWHPDDDPDPGQDAQEDLFTQWGSDSDDQPWSITLPAADAKDLISSFKLPPKAGWAPIAVEYDRQHLRGTLRVSRAQETGHIAKTVGLVGRGEEFPDLVPEFEAASEIAVKVDQIAYGACHLALFGKVRQRGVMLMQPSAKATHVRIGHRFRGLIVPAREGAA